MPTNLSPIESEFATADEAEAHGLRFRAEVEVRGPYARLMRLARSLFGRVRQRKRVIRDALRALLARDRAVENWLHEQVGPAYDALKADPSRAVTADQVRARLAAEHAKAR